MHVTFVHFRLFVHHVKNAFRTGKRRQQKIDLLGKLIYGIALWRTYTRYAERLPKSISPRIASRPPAQADTA